MSKEIIEAVRTIEREKGIEGDTLIQALEDALLAAYKKTPGATRHATVELDQETGWLVDVRDGKLLRLRSYLSHAEARDAFGREP